MLRNLIIISTYKTKTFFTLIFTLFCKEFGNIDKLNSAAELLPVSSFPLNSEELLY